MYLKQGRIAEREILHPQVHRPNSHMARAGQVQNQEPNTWAIFYCFPRQLDEKWSTWNWSQHLYGVLPTVPQHQT